MVLQWIIQCRWDDGCRQAVIGMYLRTLYLRYHVMWHMTGQVMAGVWPEATTPTAIRVIVRSKLSIPLYNGFDLHTKSPTFEQMVGCFVHVDVVQDLALVGQWIGRGKVIT